MLISEKQLQVLEYLAVYRYLTTPQFLQLGVYKSKPVIRNKALAPLKKKPLQYIKAVDFGFYPGKGRLHSIHHLTQKGAMALIESRGEESVLYPKGVVNFARDYFHRVSFIDIHIALRQWAEENQQTVNFFHNYFDSRSKKGYHLIRDTQVILNGNTLIPDGNFALDMSDGQTRLFTLELHRGDNTKKIIRQLGQHTHIIEQGLLSSKYNHEYDNYVLSVYEHENTMEKVKQAMREKRGLLEYRDYIIFNTLEHVTGNFANGWHYVDNETFLIFNT